MHYEGDHIDLALDNHIQSQKVSNYDTSKNLESVRTRAKLPRASFENEQFFQTIFNNAAVGMAIVSQLGGIVRANGTFQKIVGYSESELQDLTFPEFTHSEDVDKDVTLYRQLLAGDIDNYQMDKRYVSKDGRVKWVHLSVSLMTDQLSNNVLAIAIVQDIDEKKRTEIELEISNYRLTKAIKGAKEAIWHWPDVNQEDEWWSPGFYHVLGYDEDEIEPKISTFRSLLHPDDCEKVEQALTAHLEHNEIFDLEYRLKTKPGPYKWIRAKAITERDRPGRPTEMIGIIADIDHIKRSEQILQMRNKELENSNKELESFAYVASHDLQEPLRTVNSFLTLFQESAGDTIENEAQVYLDIANQAALRMRQLLQDLLEYSRVGTQKMDPSLIEMSDLVSEVLSDLSVVQGESEGQVEVGTLHDVYGDRNKLYRLFSNLISNSLKFRVPEIPPIIKIESVVTKHSVRFAIADNGIGINPDSKDTVFKIFKRLHTREEYEGSGIGLSVCKKIVELHHGKIWFEPAKDSGTIFFIDLPKPEARKSL